MIFERKAAGFISSWCVYSFPIRNSFPFCSINWGLLGFDIFWHILTYFDIQFLAIQGENRFCYITIVTRDNVFDQNLRCQGFVKLHNGIQCYIMLILKYTYNILYIYHIWYLIMLYNAIYDMIYKRQCTGTQSGLGYLGSLPFHRFGEPPHSVPPLPVAVQVLKLSRGINYHQDWSLPSGNSINVAIENDHL
jgi:hypothetical protein